MSNDIAEKAALIRDISSRWEELSRTAEGRVRLEEELWEGIRKFPMSGEIWAKLGDVAMLREDSAAMHVSRQYYGIGHLVDSDCT